MHSLMRSKIYFQLFAAIVLMSLVIVAHAGVGEVLAARGASTAQRGDTGAVRLLGKSAALTATQR